MKNAMLLLAAFALQKKLQESLLPPLSVALRRNIPLLLSVAVLCNILLFGCASDGAGAQQPGNQPPSSAAQFLLPSAPIPYTAHYTVSEGSNSFTKTVWRKGNAARMDLEIVPGSSFSMFFVSGRGYSCSSVTGTPICYEMRAPVLGQGIGGIFDAPDTSSGKELEPVEIGGAVGRCFLFPYTAISKRKMCFTDRNVVAWDEYNATASTTHVEYLDSIAYSAEDSVFTLPATPQVPPA